MFDPHSLASAESPLAVGGKVHEQSYEVLKKGRRLVFLTAAPFENLSDQFDVQHLRVSNDTSALAPLVEKVKQGLVEPKVYDFFALEDYKDAFVVAESSILGKVILRRQ